MNTFQRVACITIGYLFLFTTAANSQTNAQQQKAERALLSYLHKLCKEYTTNEMSIELGTIHQPYTINNGILSVVRKHQNENDPAVPFFVKTSIAISAIEDVFFDYYIGFVGVNNQSVKEEKSDNLTLSFVSVGTMNLLHVAPVGDGEQGYAIQTKLLELVVHLKKLYNADK